MHITTIAPEVSVVIVVIVIVVVLIIAVVINVVVLNHDIYVQLHSFATPTELQEYSVPMCTTCT
jgi:hypothetical protein